MNHQIQIVLITEATIKLTRKEEEKANKKCQECCPKAILTPTIQCSICLSKPENLEFNSILCTHHDDKPQKLRRKAYLIHETRAEGACKANKGTRKDL